MFYTTVSVVAVHLWSVRNIEIHLCRIEYRVEKEVILRVEPDTKRDFYSFHHLDGQSL